MRTSAVPGFAARAVELLPGLVRHRCDCGSSHGIAAELADTETAHAFEHVALEIMALAGSPRTLRGDTSWDFVRHGRGVFEVSVEFDDEAVAAGALGIASEVVDSLCRGSDPPDLTDRVARLRLQRERG